MMMGQPGVNKENKKKTLRKEELKHILSDNHLSDKEAAKDWIQQVKDNGIGVSSTSKNIKKDGKVGPRADTKC